MSRFIYCDAECHYAECRYAGCRYDECRGADEAIPKLNVIGKSPQWIGFFVTYEAAQKANAFDYTRPKMLSNDKHSSLLDPFVSYEANEVLFTWLIAKEYYLAFWA